MYKGVIFDLDGTLLDTIEDLADACNYALNECNLKTYEVNEYKRFVGDGREKLIERIIPSGKADIDLFNRVLKMYDEYYIEHMVDKTKPFDGILELLEKLIEKKIKIAVLSNKPHEFTFEMVNNYFGERFDFVYGHREGYKTKPNPQAVLDLIKEMGISREECIYVGDSNVDIQTAKNAEIKSIGVSYGFRGEEELRNEGADFIARDTSELSRYLLG